MVQVKLPEGIGNFSNWTHVRTPNFGLPALTVVTSNFTCGNIHLITWKAILPVPFLNIFTVGNNKGCKLHISASENLPICIFSQSILSETLQYAYYRQSCL